MSVIAQPPAIYAAIEKYLTVIAAHPTAEHMMEQILLEDFETGLRGGDMWRGIEGMRAWLAQREQFFDQRTELKAILSMTPISDEEAEVVTRVEFFMRRWKPPSPVSEEFTGTAFHTWRIRSDGKTLRIASLLIDGYANLNNNSRRLIASPVLGADVEE
ncbi:hypothetical protein Q9Q75_17130 [Mycobacterium intracellulare]|uniref:hypothetical protein n=1 Tax=Mycobacterium intracellulare TaxID=1767 RepID=UPI00335E02D8